LRGIINHMSRIAQRSGQQWFDQKYCEICVTNHGNFTQKAIKRRVSHSTTLAVRGTMYFLLPLWSTRVDE
jgi:hypothetical protein